MGALDERLPRGARSLRTAAWAGVQDSMPRAAVLSLHARVDGTRPDAWDDPALVQVWGPRYQLYVVPAEDLAVFTYGRLPDGGMIRARAEDLAARVRDVLGAERMRYDDVGRALGTHGNNLRYAALTGTLAVRWEGARRPLVWLVDPPAIGRDDAARELARRFLHVYGPTTAAAFGKWSGVGAPKAARIFADLGDELIPVDRAFLLAQDEELFRAEAAPPAAARLLPSGDAYWLHGTAEERALLVPDAARRDELWTPRVWPGALLVGGEIAGVWRRAQRKVTIATWRRLTRAERESVVAEAESLPLPDAGATTVEWV